MERSEYGTQLVLKARANLRVPGSIPVRSANFYQDLGAVAQMGERMACNHDVHGFDPRPLHQNLNDWGNCF